MGIRRIADFNTGDNEGIGYFHVNQKRGRRWSSARGFLKPALSRPNLRLEKNVLVDRLDRSRTAAPSACASCKAARPVEARARGEVDPVRRLDRIDAGAAPLRHRACGLAAPLGIDVVLDQPGVGRNLQDHLQQRAIYKVEGVRTLNETYYNRCSGAA